MMAIFREITLSSLGIMMIFAIMFAADLAFALTTSSVRRTMLVECRAAEQSEVSALNSVICVVPGSKEEFSFFSVSKSKGPLQCVYVERQLRSLLGVRLGKMESFSCH